MVIERTALLRDFNLGAAPISILVHYKDLTYYF